MAIQPRLSGRKWADNGGGWFVCLGRREAPKRRRRATESRTALLDHLVGAAEHREWHADAEWLASLAIDAQLDLCRLLHGQVGRLAARQYSASKNSGGAV